VEVDKMPELIGVNRRHTTVEMKLADIASRLRKAHTQEFSLAPSMSNNTPSIKTLLPWVGEGG
jgi:hypothetical protein